MPSTPNLQLEELVEGQATPEATVNAALAALDAYVMANIIDRDSTAPPGSPNDGDLYIVGASATGDWSGQDGKLAYYAAGWFFLTPAEGMFGWIADEDTPVWYDGSAWLTMTIGGLDDVASIRAMSPPGSNSAQESARAGGSTIPESAPTLLFDDSTAEYMDFYCRLSSNYAGGGIKVVLPWSAVSASSGSVVWDAAIRAFPLDTEDLDSTHSYTSQTATTATASASGELVQTEITLTDGSQMDSLAAGELFVLRLWREAADGSDNMTGDAELWWPLVQIKNA